MAIDEHRDRLRRSSRSRPNDREWVGGRVVAPFYITEGTPYRPELILWLELPELAVVFFQLSKPGEASSSFGATLLEATESPLIGPPRRPGTVRVADARKVAEVRQVLPEIRIVEAPTPEIQHLLELMSEAASQDVTAEKGDRREEPSYFEDGRVGIEAIEDLFHAAKLLYHVAPWKVAGDCQVLRVDIPAHDVEGACLSIIGALGQNIGIILFPSLEGCERFLEVADAPIPPGAPIDVGTTSLSLNYEAASDLPAAMHREALEHGWPVGDPGAYPVVQHRDRDGVLRPLSERDVRVVSACAMSLAAFFGKHRDLFERDAFDEPVCESYSDHDDPEVRFTVPYEAGELFEANTSRHPPKAAAQRSPSTGGQGTSRAAKIGRNQPCPCGSGKKYKLCCLARERLAGTEAGGRSTSPDAEIAPAACHDLDRELAGRMNRYARDRLGPGWMDVPAGAFHDPTPPEELLGPWALYHHLFEGKPIVQWFLDDHAGRLGGTERAWLNAQRAAWLSVWEVLDVEPGTSLTLRDLLTDETRTVLETTASRSLVKRDAVLARVIDHQGTSVLCGLFPRSLPPRDAAVVVKRTHGRLRRKSSIPVERMRGEAIGRYLIARWEEALEEADTRTGLPPVLENTDGDPLLITVDHFVFDPADRAEIQRRLAAAKEVEHPPEPEDPEQIYVFSLPGNRVHQDWESTITGSATISGNTLRMESNSLERADSMRKRLETLLGSLIRHRAREHSDPIASLRREGGAARTSSAPPIPSDEMDRVILEIRAKHYAGWADHPLPALGGETPRAAVRTKSGREEVDLLLKESENLEARLPAGQRFDFSRIRRELGLEE